VISSISPSNIADSDSSVDITIVGSNFITGGQTVKAVGTDGSEISAGTVTRNSSTELVANFDGTSFSDANEDYDVVITNSASSLTATLADSLSVNASPVFVTSAGSLGTIGNYELSSYTLSSAATTDDEGDSLTYSISVGSLPAGLSINSSTGAITGTATAVGSDTTSTFTVSVTDGTNTNTRQFSITVSAPVITSYTSTGSGTFSVPSGITAVDVLVVAGGGGGGVWVGGGGGAGGLIYRPAFPVTPGGSVSYTVGSGGAGGTATGPTGGTVASGGKGQNSTFGTLSALGGGVGLAYANVGQPIKDGGSGGGASGENPSDDGYTHQVGTGIQSQQPGDSGTYGFGNPGGYGQTDGPWAGGGGGGAGGAGINGTVPSAGQGGVGKQYDISGSQVYYAGGGGGGVNGPAETAVGTGGQGGGAIGAGITPGGAQTSMTNGNANRGGGGGGNGNAGPAQAHTAGDGGSGIIIVKY
jgi:hypothetical protein